jgi:hypothetical protein
MHGSIAFLHGNLTQQIRVALVQRFRYHREFDAAHALAAACMERLRMEVTTLMEEPAMRQRGAWARFSRQSEEFLRPPAAEHPTVSSTWFGLMLSDEMHVGLDVGVDMYRAYLRLVGNGDLDPVNREWFAVRRDELFVRIAWHATAAP